MDVTSKKSTGQDLMTTAFVRRHLEWLYEQSGADGSHRVDFTALAKEHGLHPSSLVAVRTGKDGVGAKLRPKYARLMGFESERELYLAALRAFILEQVAGAAPGIDSLAVMEGERKAMATARVLGWLETPSSRDRILRDIESESQIDDDGAAEVGAALKNATAKTARKTPARR
jgi:hypothetical protein